MHSIKLLASKIALLSLSLSFFCLFFFPTLTSALTVLPITNLALSTCTSLFLCFLCPPICGSRAFSTPSRGAVSLARQSVERLVSGPTGTAAHFTPHWIFRLRRGLFYRSGLMRRGDFPMTERNCTVPSLEK